jgi:hypothetical protein
VEFSLSISKVIVILVGIVITGLSMYRGADILSIGLRSGASMFAIGILLWMMNWIINNNMLETAREAQTTPAKSEKKTAGNAQKEVE